MLIDVSIHGDRAVIYCEDGHEFTRENGTWVDDTGEELPVDESEYWEDVVDSVKERYGHKVMFVEWDLMSRWSKLKEIDNKLVEAPSPLPDNVRNLAEFRRAR